MSNNRINALATTLALGFAAFFLGIAPAHGEPTGCPAASTVVDGTCSSRLAAVTAKDFTVTGTLVGSQPPITLSGQPSNYLPSTGFGTPPDAVLQWDAAINRVANLDPADPNWYGNGKAKAFLPTQLNLFATQFAPATLVVRFVPDQSTPAAFQVLSVQPVG